MSTQGRGHATLYANSFLEEEGTRMSMQSRGHATLAMACALAEYTALQ